MDAKLVVVGGEAQVGEYPLRLPAIIGRSRSADLKLAHPLVSRKHCELYESDGQLMIRDLGSLNGTFIGESRISGTAPLPPGTKVTIGAVTFRAVYGNMDAAQLTDSKSDDLVDFLSTPAVAAPMEQTLEMSEANVETNEEVDSPITDFVTPEEQPKSGEDDDMSDFFASLK